MIEVPNAVTCPICDKPAELISAEREISYGRRQVLVDDEFYRCTGCGEEFYVNGQMAATDARAAAKVWKESGTLLPFEIRAIRDSFGYTQAEFERLIGAGPKTVVRWESGKITPNATTCRLLRILREFPGVAETLAGYSQLGNRVKPALPPSSQTYTNYQSPARASTMRLGSGGFTNFRAEQKNLCQRPSAPKDTVPEEQVG